jgi:hypothetical protein
VAAVGASILWLSYASSMSASEISGLVAKGSFACLYLISAFSTVGVMCVRVSVRYRLL